MLLIDTSWVLIIENSLELKTTSVKNIKTNKLKMKIMKTKTRIFIAICALGIIGLTNINAVSDSNRDEVVNNKGEMLNNESSMNDEAFIYSAQAYSAVDFENEVAYYSTIENYTEQNTLTDEAVVYSAQVYATNDFENEIAEYSTDQILPEANVLTNEVHYSAKCFAAADFENEIKIRQ